MLKARKANRVIRIPDEKKDAYVALGYTVTDMNGQLLAAPDNPEREVKELKQSVADLKVKLNEASDYAEKADFKIEELEKENAALKKMLEDLESKSKVAVSQKKSDAAKQAVQGTQSTK